MALVRAAAVKKKPRLVAQNVSKPVQTGRAPSIFAKQPAIKKTTAAVGPVAAAKPVGTPEAAPSLTVNPTAPPETPQGKESRIGANENWGNLLSTVNPQAMDLARQYGGFSTAYQYDAEGNPYSVALPGLPDPNSAVAVAGRNRDLANRNTQYGHMDTNTFLSGLNLRDVSENTSAYDRAMQAAHDEYYRAIRNLNSTITGGLAERNRGRRGANLTDYEAAQANPPEAQAAPGAAGAANAGAFPTPGAGPLTFGAYRAAHPPYGPAPAAPVRAPVTFGAWNRRNRRAW